MNDRLAVITCVWQRPERLGGLLDGLAAQEFTAFDVVLINNNLGLRSFVDKAVARREMDVRLWHNQENRGPYARIEAMCELRGQYDWFLWLDDDIEFDSGLVGEWMQQAELGTLKSWQGFRFTGNYWQREKMEPEQECHYLMGSNMLIPAEAVRREGVRDMPIAYRLCADDLWLCYWADHKLGMRLTAGRADVSVAIDGRDTYLHHHDTKIRFLDELRTMGWSV